MINLLLMQQGSIPKYYGKSSQTRYSIDFAVEDDSGLIVHRCVNADALAEKGLRDALDLFEVEWLGERTLPTPEKLVLCCPALPRHIADGEECGSMKRRFSERTGIRVQFWDSDYLDGRLKHSADLVADIFCDQTVEWFCGLNDWNSDLFLPLTPVPCGKTLERYFNLKETGRIYVDPNQREEFREALGMNGSLLIRGLPGSGKTITTLALAESYRKNELGVFHIDLGFALEESDIVTGIGRRLSKPTIFVIDNCQGKFEMLDRALNRLSGKVAQKRGRIFLVFLARNVPTDKGILRGDYSEFEENFKQIGALLDYKTSPDQFLKIIEISKPAFAGLSKERLEKTFHFCAGDLFLLTQLLDTIDSPDEIDGMNLEILLRKCLYSILERQPCIVPVFRNLPPLPSSTLRRLSLHLALKSRRKTATPHPNF